MRHARVILWVQWRTLRNVYPRAGVGWSAIIGTIWYGVWSLAAMAIARVIAGPEDVALIATALPGALLLMFLYWQVVPLMMAASGASLDLRKLLAYPIPIRQFFGIEVLLRTSAALEMMLVTLGIALGIVFNPALRLVGITGAAAFILFNLLLAVGIRDVVTRILSHRRIREIAFFVLILIVALPQIALRRLEQGDPMRGRFPVLFGGVAWPGWPWTAATNLMESHNTFSSALVMLTWCAAAGIFARWQFARTLTFDSDAAGASGDNPLSQTGALEWLYRLPSALLHDPLGILVEKEIRSLTRSPRFRLVFLMGFTFGLILWLPMVFRGSGEASSGLSTNYLTVVSVYSLLLLSEACFWNSFGFDRSAAQIYFLAPVSFPRVLIAKNISGLFFVAIEIAVIALVCGLLRMPLGLTNLSEAYGVAAVVSVFLLSAGNLMSVHHARGTDPSKSFRTGSAGRVQAMLFVIYPIAFAPAGLAYLARYAFEREAALFLVLLLDLVIGLVFYKISLDSASEAAVRMREQMIVKLSSGAGPIEA